MSCMTSCRSGPGQIGVERRKARIFSAIQAVVVHRWPGRMRLATVFWLVLAAAMGIAQAQNEFFPCNPSFTAEDMEFYGRLLRLFNLNVADDVIAVMANPAEEPRYAVKLGPRQYGWKVVYLRATVGALAGGSDSESEEPGLAWQSEAPLDDAGRHV